MSRHKQHNLSRMIDILACPGCLGHPIILLDTAVRCSACRREYEVQDGVPFLVFETAGRVVRRYPISEDGLGALSDLPSSLENPVLRLGGDDRRHSANYIQVDADLLEGSDLVADAHRLPFQDHVFATILSAQGLEVSPDPAAVALELHRVLRPGGKLIIRTAFLRPPASGEVRYYYATDYGFGRWFSAFHLARCTVPQSMNPALALGKLFADILHEVKVADESTAGDLLAGTTLAELRQIWADPGARHGFAWELLGRMSPEAGKRFALGLELKARKPV